MESLDAKNPRERRSGFPEFSHFLGGVAGNLSQVLKTPEEYTQRSIYDHVITDSNVERGLAEALYGMDEAKLFIKLPDWFLVPAPGQRARCRRRSAPREPRPHRHSVLAGHLRAGFGLLPRQGAGYRLGQLCEAERLAQPGCHSLSLQPIAISPIRVAG